jgi:hypothetical protein
MDGTDPTVLLQLPMTKVWWREIDRFIWIFFLWLLGCYKSDGCGTTISTTRTSSCTSEIHFKWRIKSEDYSSSFNNLLLFFSAWMGELVHAFTLNFDFLLFSMVSRCCRSYSSFCGNSNCIWFN